MSFLSMIGVEILSSACLIYYFVPSTFDNQFILVGIQEWVLITNRERNQIPTIKVPFIVPIYEP